MSSGGLSFKSTSDDRFLKSFFIEILFTLRVFCLEICWEDVVDVWPDLNSNLPSNKWSHYLLDYVNFNNDKRTLHKRCKKFGRYPNWMIIMINYIMHVSLSKENFLDRMWVNSFVNLISRKLQTLSRTSYWLLKRRSLIA